MVFSLKEYDHLQQIVASELQALDEDWMLVAEEGCWSGFRCWKKEHVLSLSTWPKSHIGMLQLRLRKS